uniref:B-related factor 1 n=1 Tax=Angiostrongylus cantonensis TaxID=6313 RepID=A0A0K0DCQ4_ANGCA
MSRTCPHCGCSDIDEDATRGDSSCTNCGAVLEESIIVSENQFQERSGGSGHTLVGQFVPVERAQSHACVSGNGLVSQESREVTFAKGRKLIEEIASQLRINQRCVDTSYNFFKMCVSRNLTRGRIRSHVVAACLYMTCRLENTAHLLLDFSDVTQVNVFDLGRTLSFLSRSLRINLPSTDPCLYVMRFACLLELGEKQKEVVNLATRLVQRMKRDWMSTGRRPTGLCGAALLLAARSFNFNRSISDVVRVVHISESVVRKRLEEFSQTPSSALTIDEFSTVDLEHCEDPPAYRESQRKAREEQLAKEAEAAARMEKDVGSEELERALEKKRRERFKHTSYAKIVAGEIGMNLFSFHALRMFRRGTPDYRQYAPSLDSLGITQRPTSNNVPSLSIIGIDDDEIDTYILTSSESAMKERFWMKLNGEYIKEMERRHCGFLESREHLGKNFAIAALMDQSEICHHVTSLIPGQWWILVLVYS